MSSSIGRDDLAAASAKGQQVKAAEASAVDSRMPPPELTDLARMHYQAGHDDAAFLEARARWVDRFHAVHFARFGDSVAVGVAEVTPKRPPYDYPAQGRNRGMRRRRRDSKQDGDSEAWHFWRELLVAAPVQPGYHDLNILLEDIADLHLRATYYTDPEDSAFCHRLLRSPLDDCWRAYSDWPSNEAPPECAKIYLQSARARLDSVADIYVRSAQRRTVTQYSLGMIIGSILIPIIVFFNVVSFQLLNLVAPDSGLPVSIRAGVYVGCTLGGVGAACSVLLRINTEKVDIDHESTRHGTNLWLNPVVQRGAARIVIGSLFGGVVAWLLHADIFTPSAWSESAENQVLLTGAGAFVAGFSERFVPDLVLRKSK